MIYEQINLNVHKYDQHIVCYSNIGYSVTIWNKDKDRTYTNIIYNMYPLITGSTCCFVYQPNRGWIAGTR